MAEEKKSFTSGDPQTPVLRIFKQEDGKFTIRYAESDPLGKREEIDTDLDPEVQRLFGYSGWEEYKAENRTDLTRKVVKDPETGKILQAPTVHPFHVAYAMEEFTTKGFKPEEYELVAIPGSKREVEKPAPEPAISMQENLDSLKEYSPYIQVPDPSPRVEKDPEKEAEQDARRASRKREPQSYWTGDVAETATLEGEGNITAIRSISQLRKNFFGDLAAESNVRKLGIMGAAMRNPVEGLANKKIIDRIKKKHDFKKLFSEGLPESMPVRHPRGQYWEKDPKSYNATTNDAKLAMKMDPKDVLSSAALLKEFYPAGLEKRSIDKTLEMTPEEQEMAHMLLSFFDPTGLTGWPDVYRAYGKLQDEGSTAMNWAELTFAAMAAIPLVGVVAKPIKAKKAVDATLKAGELAMKVAKTPAQKATAKEALRWAREGQEVLEAPEAIIQLRKNAQRVEKTHPEMASSLRQKATDLEEILKKGSVKRLGFKPGRGGPRTFGEIGHGMIRGSEIAGGEFAEDPVDAPIGTGAAGAPGVEMPDVPVKKEDLEVYLLPVGWRRGDWLTPAEKTLAQRVGANIDFRVSIPKTSGPGVGKTTPVATEGSRFLVFGHSQASKSFQGGPILAKIKAGGGNVAHHKVLAGYSDGHSEKGLDKAVKDIPKKDYTHAFLFLGGNTGTKGPDYQRAKRVIIDHVSGPLGVPKENIIVVLPPINLDRRDYDRRALNQRAKSFFNSMGVAVAPIVFGREKDFSDRLHIKASSAAAQQGADRAMGQIPVVRRPPSVATTTPHSKLQVAKIVAEEAVRAGVDPVFAIAIANVESGLDPMSNADGSSVYKGLFQMGKQYQDEWKRIGGLDWENVHEPRHASRAFMRILKKRVAALGPLVKSTVGNPAPGDAGIMYASWQQGLRGIKEIGKAAGKNARFTELPKDIQYNIPANHYGKKYAPRGMSSKQWKAAMYNKFEEMGEEAIRLGLAEKKRGWKRHAWRKLPENNRVYRQYYSLANRLTPKMFLDRWREYFSFKMRQAQGIYDSLGPQSAEVTESKIIKQIFDIIGEIQNSELDKKQIQQEIS